MRKQSNQHALCDVVRLFALPVSIMAQSSIDILPRHSSIDATIRAARGLPEDLIRLCVGIEDKDDLLDDLEHAFIDAGAIEFSTAQNRYVRLRSLENDEAITRAVEKLALKSPQRKEVEWFVSAPGKVILFGEHAVVHGVVSYISPWVERMHKSVPCLGNNSTKPACVSPTFRLTLSVKTIFTLSLLDCNRSLSRSSVLWPYDPSA